MTKDFFFFQSKYIRNIAWETFILKIYLLFIWNTNLIRMYLHPPKKKSLKFMWYLNLTGHPVFLFAKSGKFKLNERQKMNEWLKGWKA